MNDRDDFFRSKNDGAVPRLSAALALSVLVHAAALWVAPQKPVLTAEPLDDSSRAPLSLRLLPPAPLPGPAVIPSPPPAPRPKAALPPRPTPPAAVKPAPVPQAPAPVAPPASPPPAMTGDLASYIEARRRSQASVPPAPPAENTDDRARRVIEGNLGSTRSQAFGYDPEKSGGMFNIEQLGSDYAEFTYHGWRSDIGRNTKQLIAVHRGNNPDIRIVVVRRMIAIIRDNTQEDFLWVSKRLGRSVMLSARPRDNAGLEEFLMNDFFHQTAPAQR